MSPEQLKRLRELADRIEHHSRLYTMDTTTVPLVVGWSLAISPGLGSTRYVVTKGTACFRLPPRTAATFLRDNGWLREARATIDLYKKAAA